MDKFDRKNNKYNISYEDSLECSDKVASSTDCTGLVQKPPANTEQSESYTDLHNIPRPRDHRNKLTKQEK